MRDGLRFSVAINEFALSALCITVIACAVGYFHARRPQPAPAPAEVCAPQPPPTITITQTFYMPVKVDVETPSPTPEQGEKEKIDPVFAHRVPVITDALRHPMPEAAQQ
jgi:hypothetical protein